MVELDPGLYGPEPRHQRGTLMIFIIHFLYQQRGQNLVLAIKVPVVPSNVAGSTSTGSSQVVLDDIASST